MKLHSIQVSDVKKSTYFNIMATLTSYLTKV